MKDNPTFAHEPTHIGIIPDGVRRWAKNNGVDLAAAFAKVIPMLEEILSKTKIKYLTILEISTENLDRPKNELNVIFSILRKFVSELLPVAYKHQCVLGTIGNLTKLPRDLKRIFDDAEKETRHYSRKIYLAINYSGRRDILGAINQFIMDNPGKEISEFQVNKYISLTRDQIPDPDLIIRSGSDSKCRKTSNFLSWQSTYTEFYFMGKMLPDIKFEDIKNALDSYGKTKRRFGK